MNCPNCGDNNAVALFTSVQCANSNCQNYNQIQATETSMKSFEFRGTGTITGRFSSSQPNFSNLPRTKQPLNETILSMQKIQKGIDCLSEAISELSEAISELNEIVRKIEVIETGVFWAHDSFDGFASEKPIKKKWDGFFQKIPTDYIIPTRWT